MMRDECVICRGNRVIRLPVYRPLGVHQDDVPIAMDEAYREYPCPECSAGDNVPFERLGIVKETREARKELIGDPRFIEIIRGGMARAIGDALLERGYIKFEQSAPDYRGIFATRATMGAVAPSVVSKFEERVAERQFEIAHAVVNATSEEIANWGSYYHGREGGSVSKSQAIEWMCTALKKMKAKYAGK